MQALAKAIHLWVLIIRVLRMSSWRYADRFLLQFIRLTALRGCQVHDTTRTIVAVRVHHHVLTTGSWVILFDFGIGCPLSVNIQRIEHIFHLFELFGFQSRIDPIYHVIVRLLLLLFHFRKLLEMLLPKSHLQTRIMLKGKKMIENNNNLRFFLVSFRNSSKGRRQCLWNLRFHHFVESLTHFFLMCLYLSHGRYVPLWNLVMVFHIILQSLIIIILHLFAGNAAHFGELIRLVIRSSLGHDLILRVESQLAMTAFQFGHEWRG